MNDNNSPRNQVVATAAAGSLRTNTKRAEEAAAEVVEVTDTTTVGGLAVEPASQAVQVAEGAETLSKEERKAVSRSVFQLAWPAIAENALQTMLGIVDTAVVARLGVAALSGVGVSQQLIWVLTTALVAVSMGTTVVIAHFTGAKQFKQASAVLKQSLMLATVFGLVLAPVALISLPMLTALGLGVEAANEGAVYLQITLAASIFIVLMFVAGAALRGAGDTKTPMLVTAFINVINAVLAVVLVFGGSKASEILSGWLSGLLHVQVTLPGLDWT